VVTKTQRMMSMCFYMAGVCHDSHHDHLDLPARSFVGVVVIIVWFFSPSYHSRKRRTVPGQDREHDDINKSERMVHYDVELES
jgi:hypothetical protein